jgi:hypothetical protein
MLVCGIPLSFLQLSHLYVDLPVDTHIGFRNSSLQAIAMGCSFAVSPVSFLQLSHLYVDLPVDTHTGFRHTSLHAIAMEAEIALATPNKSLFSVERLFANFTQVPTGHA